MDTATRVDGFSCDAWIEPSDWPDRPLLVEIKSSAQAADVHMGVGQLMLYPEILKNVSGADFFSGCRRVLLPPNEQGTETQIEAARSRGLLVHRYTVEGSWEDQPLKVHFDDGFRKLCGIP